MKDERAIVLEDGERYLEVCYRIEDARKDGCAIITELELFNSAMAVVKAKVVNAAGRILSEAYGSRQKKYEEAYLEHAETAAIGRALSEAGYNIFSYELSENIEDHKIVLDEDGNDYLNVAFRIALFRKTHPEAVITKKILSGPENGTALMSVTITEGERVIATAHAFRAFIDTEQNRNYLECAETAAVGRALSILGFDLPPGQGNQFADSEDKADMPAKSETENTKEEKGKKPRGKEDSKKTAVKPDEAGKVNKKSDSEKKTPKSDKEAAQEPDKGMQESVPAEPGNPEGDHPNDNHQDETVAKPEDYVLTSGKYAGKTLGCIWLTDWTYVRKAAFTGTPKTQAGIEGQKAAAAVCRKHGVDSINAEPVKTGGGAKDDVSKIEAETAGEMTIGLRAHAGQTIREVYDTDPDYVRWLAYEYHGEKSLAAAAKAYYEFKQENSPAA